MYDFVSGPLVWIAFIVFVGGLVYQFVTMLRLAKNDKIYPYMSVKYSLRSLAHWIVPFASRNMRMRYETTIITFAFHLCLVLVPIFLTAHVMMFSFSWGPKWGTLTERTGDWLTVSRHTCRRFLPGAAVDAPGSKIRYLCLRLSATRRCRSSVYHRLHGLQAVV